MSLYESFVRLFSGVKSVAPYLITVTAVTILLFAVLRLFSKKLWVNDSTWSWMSLFLGLGGRNAVAMACSWIKFCALASYLVLFREMELVDYTVFAVPALIFSLLVTKPQAIVTRLFWNILELWAIFAANLVCSYKINVTSSKWMTVVYIVMSAFVFLFGVYRFLSEVSEISGDRTIDPDRVWGDRNDYEEY